MRSLSAAAASSIRPWTMLVLALVLSGCGGGGGGSSAAPGTFTMSAGSMTFKAFKAGTAPATQSVTINITGSNVAVLGAAYTDGQTKPSWLDIQLTGSGTTYTMTIGIQTAAVDAGSYSTVFQVGTVDAGGNILTHQSFTVALSVSAGLALSTAPVNTTFTFGDSLQTQAVPVSVVAGDRQWTLSTDTPWLTAPKTAQSGDGTLTATINAASLTSGTYTGHIIATNTAEPLDSQALTVTVSITPATFTVAESSYVIGGADGKTPVSTPTPVTMALSTGQASYPYSVTLTTADLGNWLSVDHPTGSVGSAGTTINLAVDATHLVPGTYSAQIKVDANVNGTPFTQTRPITVNIEANRIVVEAAGVGLSKIAGNSVLSRKVTVHSSLGRTDTPWTASADQNWLTVTSSGMTGGQITLTADPTAAPLDTTQFATVTIQSSDPSVQNQQTIRVGLFVSNTAPVNTGFATSVNTLAASPVEPVVAVGNGTATINLYNVNSGVFLRALTNTGGASISSLAFSQDGAVLYVYDSVNARVNAIDMLTGVRKATYDATVAGLGAPAAGTAMLEIRPNGYSLLLTPGSHIYDLTDASVSYVDTSISNTIKWSGSPDQSLIVNEYGIVDSITRTALNGGQLAIKRGVLATSTVGGAVGEACISAAGDRIYTASGAPYDFPATSVATSQVIQTLAGAPYPNSIQCVWNGAVVGGINGYGSTNDIYVYDGPSGTSLGNLSSNGTASGITTRSLVPRGLAVSADGTRLISAYAAGPGTTTATGVYFGTLPH